MVLVKKEHLLKLKNRCGVHLQLAQNGMWKRIMSPANGEGLKLAMGQAESVAFSYISLIIKYF